MNEYVKERTAYSNGKKTLSVKAEFFPIKKEDAEKNEKPYDIHKGYSRFVISLLNPADEANKFASINVLAGEDIKTLYSRGMEAYKLALKKEWEVFPFSQKEESAEEKLSCGYTTTISSGSMKGKTPCQILLEDSRKKEDLERQKKWLEGNLSNAQYRAANQKQIDAINDALNLFDAGMLVEKKTNSQELKEFTVFKNPIKIPNATKVDEAGFTKVYSFSITCNLNMNLPFEIHLMNGMAKPLKLENNKISAELSNMKCQKNLSLRLSADAFQSFITWMYDRNNNFENAYFPTMHKMALDIDNANFEKKKNQAG